MKSCFQCGKAICPRCQWRDSHHTFCGHACHRKHLILQKVKEIRWFAIREARAFCQFLYEKATGIPIKNSFVPMILPILTLSFIHTYTTLSLKKSEPLAITVRLNITPEAEIKAVTANLGKQDKALLSPKPRVFIPDITRGSLLKNELSLTFDGGSEATDAEDILNVLREKNIQTTIFLTGEFIKKYPELVKKMAEDGHEIGNHSMTHPHLTTFEKNFKQQTLPDVNKEFITRQLKETATIFKDTTGKDMAPLWRAPYGEQNAEIRQWAYEAGFTHIGWTADSRTKQSLDSLDWVSNEESEFYHSADEIKDRILNFDKDGHEVKGGIVLMHLGTDRKDSHVSAKLPEIIDSLEQRGYRIVKVSELLNEIR
ncbi:MAG: polysaccharide deacetylase family protein [Deltaproteobacteria bacterium]|nr:polysaccharide deacetylase family protein [Deltaproteobacteria bacterium]